MTNPKLRQTPEDEAAIEQAERMHNRAHIIELGIASPKGSNRMSGRLPSAVSASLRERPNSDKAEER